MKPFNSTPPSAARLIRQRGSSGYTLFEVCLAIAVFSILMGAIFGIVAAVTSLSQEIAVGQSEELKKRALTNLLRQAFHQIPSDQAVTLDIKELSSGKYEQTVNFPPNLTAFRLGEDSPFRGLKTQVQSRPITGGYRSVSLNFVLPNQPEAEPIFSLNLLRDVAFFRWRFYAAERKEWLEKWPPQAKRPHLAELTFALGAAPPARHVFAIPSLRSHQSSSGRQENEEEPLPPDTPETSSPPLPNAP